MPVAGRIYTKKINLDGYDEEAWVEIITNPKADLWVGLDNLETQERNVALVSRVMHNWNFTDPAGAPLPITPETVKNTLSLFDLIKIEQAIGDLSGLSDSKKNN